MNMYIIYVYKKMKHKYIIRGKKWHSSVICSIFFLQSYTMRVVNSTFSVKGLWHEKSNWPWSFDIWEVSVPSKHPPHYKQSIYFIKLQKRLVLDPRGYVTSPGRSHLHKHCLQSNTLTNSLLLTIAPPPHLTAVTWSRWMRVLRRVRCK